MYIDMCISDQDQRQRETAAHLAAQRKLEEEDAAAGVGNSSDVCSSVDGGVTTCASANTSSSAASPTPGAAADTNSAAATASAAAKAAAKATAAAVQQATADRITADKAAVGARKVSDDAEAKRALDNAKAKKASDEAKAAGDAKAIADEALAKAHATATASGATASAPASVYKGAPVAKKAGVGMGVKPVLDADKRQTGLQVILVSEYAHCNTLQHTATHCNTPGIAGDTRCMLCCVSTPVSFISKVVCAHTRTHTCAHTRTNIWRQTYAHTQIPRTYR